AQSVGAGGALGKAEVAVLFNDERAPEGHKEKTAHPPAEQREGKDPPEGELRAKAEKDQRGNGEHYAGRERFTRRAGGLHDVVLENGRAAKGAEDADRQYGDRDRTGHAEAGTQSHINGEGTEQ